MIAVTQLVNEIIDDNYKQNQVVIFAFFIFSKNFVWHVFLGTLINKIIIVLGRNVLQLFNIRETRNFTCVAASKLGMIETQSTVKVQGKFLHKPKE